MSVAALFTIARRQNQINVPNGGIDKEYVAHIYSGILLTLKKNKIMLCVNMDEPRDCHTE